MPVRVTKAYQSHYPRDLVKMVKKILRRVPEQYLIGLDEVILVDKIMRRHRRDSAGIYVRKNYNETTHIEIAVTEAYRGIPKIAVWVPLLSKLALARILLHEIGHHNQTLSRTPTKRQIEEDANKFKKKHIAEVFPVWAAILRAVARIVYFHKRRNKKNTHTIEKQRMA